MAVVLITLAIFSGLGLIISTMKANEVSKNRIIAINLNRESIEAMRVIRDTNWLVYSNQKRICWNNNPNEGICQDNDNNVKVTDTPITEGYYTIDLKQDYTFSLNLIENSTDNWDNTEIYLENGIYTHRSIDPTTHIENLKSIFSRRIRVAYLDDDGNQGDVYNPEKNNRMEIQAETKFSEKNQVKSVTFSTHLSDHLGRDNHLD